MEIIAYKVEDGVWHVVLCKARDKTELCNCV